MSLSSIRHLSFFYTIGIIEISIVCMRALNGLHDSTFDILGKILIDNKGLYCILLLGIGIFSYYQFLNHSKEATNV